MSWYEVSENWFVITAFLAAVPGLALVYLLDYPNKKWRDYYAEGHNIPPSTLGALWAAKLLKRGWPVLFGLPLATLLIGGVLWLQGK